MRLLNPKYVLRIVIILLAVLMYWYYWGSSRAPSGQPPLTSLTTTNVETFQRVFNDATDRMRLVLLLSPT
jgi:hypothetical protein